MPSGTGTLKRNNSNSEIFGTPTQLKSISKPQDKHSAWDRELLKLFEPFQNLDSRTLAFVEKCITYQSIPGGTTIVSQGASFKGMYFIVSGQVAVNVNGQSFGSVAKGSYFGAEALGAAVRGLNEPTNVPTSVAEIKSIQTCELLVLRCSQLAADPESLMAIVRATRARRNSSNDGSDQNQLPPNPASPDADVRNLPGATLPPQGRGGDQKMETIDARQEVPSEDAIQDLEKQRDILLRKVEAAKLLAKKQELESLMNQHRSSEATEPPNDKFAMGGMSRKSSSEIDLPAMANSGSEMEGVARNGSGGSAKSGFRAMRRSSSETDLASPRGRAVDSGANSRVESGSSTSSKADPDHFRKEKERLQFQLNLLMKKRELEEQQKAQAAELRTQNLQVQVMASKINKSIHIHPLLRGVIPLPRGGPSSPSMGREKSVPRGSDIEKDRHKFDPAPACTELQTTSFSTKSTCARWGPVWENSEYFRHKVYMKNVPKKGIPVDTNGDGTADSLAVDFTGDGKVDTIISDSAVSRTFSQTPSQRPGSASFVFPKASNLQSAAAPQASHRPR